ncbi:fatty acid desaturase [Amycolatopsis sp. NBC_01480]|uniref:fatty acid desaturase n=1 Tax=Amycolatopsis sp. NBC_01480 TaxID=2903562 RepID=UPI002E28B8B5|nr:fatty acid desaturase [Amycolatopsis sp. NBC_01480]
MPVVDSRPPGAGERSPATVPGPRISLPPVSLPALALFLCGLALWATAAWLLLAGLASPWLTIPLDVLATFVMFTVAHESAHHTAGRLTWLNEVLGRLSTLFVAAYGSFPLFRSLHLSSHHHATSARPDPWVTQGRWWQLPFRWLTIDFRFARHLPQHLRGRPSGERTEGLVALAAFAALATVLVAAGYGWELLVLYLIPQRLGLGLMMWWFGWLPHHQASAEQPPGRVRAGLRWLMKPVLLHRNYYLLHQLRPVVPFHRYLRTRAAPAGPWGRELTTTEHRAWRRLTKSFAEPPAPPAAPEPGPRRFHRLLVDHVEPTGEDAVVITFAVPDQLRETFRHRAGQHVAVRALIGGMPVRRTYSICSAEGSGLLRIAVRRRDGGAFSSYANSQLRAGDQLDVLPPSGGFTLTPVPGRAAHYVALAAGSGITPVLSILATALRDEPHSRATLLFVNTSGATTMFADEIGALARQWAGRLHVIHYRTDERDPDLHAHRPARHFDTVGEALAISHERYLSGRLDGTRLRALLQNRLHPAKVDRWFLCGPRGLLDLVKQTLAENYVPDEDVHFELFAGAPARRPQGAPAKLSVNVGNLTSEVVTKPGETVLDASLRAGLDVPYSCTGGACGSCVARLARGRVDMDVRYAPTEADVAENRILTCRARPTTAELAVDYDR